MSEQSQEVFVISVAAELAGMHAQTLRTYDRLGLVIPQRTRGGGRRYSHQDIAALRKVQRLSQDEGVNLAGIKEILELSKKNRELRDRVAELEAENAALRDAARGKPRPPRQDGQELVHLPASTAIVMWQPRSQRTPRNSHSHHRPDAV
ncbi:heat shock protein transcriptional repressor HspR [Corynebacterium caspium]|uniref:heat shock protein transcriptional repressor HspR n=1 Tax=Corynebacterium caspium TaxID=234828 RepID=UPI0003668B97|nr:helix-turn-helix transcriptional regulator [Corynebacterium caspium]WKD58635.1 Putative heat shock protein HspR [Corynebacterium caspium DSM 44850]